MAKKTANIKIKLKSTESHYFYVVYKNARKKTEKVIRRKYDPVVRRHVDFKEEKIK